MTYNALELLTRDAMNGLHVEWVRLPDVVRVRESVK
jgi:hypothetical protein